MTTSDYGSDIDLDGEEAINALISTLDANPIARPNLESESLVDEFNAPSVRVVYVPRLSQGSSSTAYFSARERKSGRKRGSAGRIARLSDGNVAVGYKELELDRETVETFVRSPPDAAASSRRSEAREPSVEKEIDGDDTRSPLARFRTAPKKPLSVTDLVSPAWCELQYWYALTKFGKKKRTPAMRQGSAVHKTLEEQVHTTVPITVQTKEDGWGLRIWNVIQGLRTLRATGMTRELEIWGVVHGQVVNGVIDEVSYTCPSPELEAEIEAKKASKSGKTAVPADQQTLEQFFSSQRSNTAADLSTKPSASGRKIYLTDVKTRSRHTLPTSAAMRPTIMQLMLYRSLFASLAANDVPADTIFTRYGVNSTTLFSDEFINQVGGLDFNLPDELDPSPGNSPAFSSQIDAVQELQQHNNLTLLWQLMIQEFTKTVHSADSISDVLCAQFIHAREEVVIGTKCFAYDQADLERYVQDEMQWWKGERPAKGVDIEDAYKCRICEFADGCTWRKEKIEEAVSKHRERNARNSSTGVEER